MDKQGIITKRNLIARETFYFLTSLGIVSVILEAVWPNIILARFNLNYLLLLWFASGLIMLFRRQHN